VLAGDEPRPFQIGTRNASEIQVSCEDVVPRSCWNRPFSTAGIASATCAMHTASAAATSVPRVRLCQVSAVWVTFPGGVQSCCHSGTSSGHEPKGSGSGIGHLRNPRRVGTVRHRVESVERTLWFPDEFQQLSAPGKLPAVVDAFTHDRADHTFPSCAGLAKLSYPTPTIAA
jgi:hypothetical protein